MNLAMNPMQPHLRNNLTEMYPGIYQSGRVDDHHHDGPNLPTAPLNTLLGFELETYQVPLDQLLPSKKVPDGVMSTRKYKQIVSSINEVGLIEPLSVIQPDRKKPEYLVLDGHQLVSPGQAAKALDVGGGTGQCRGLVNDEARQAPAFGVQGLEVIQQFGIGQLFAALGQDFLGGHEGGHRHDAVKRPFLTDPHRKIVLRTQC